MDATLLLMHRLHRASQVAEAYFTSASTQPLTSRQLILLQLIERNPGCSQTHIVNHSGIDRSTVADLVMRLVALGHVKRRRSPIDARAYELFLTDQGQATLAAGLKAARTADAALKRALNGRAEQLHELLNLVASLQVPYGLKE